MSFTNWEKHRQLVHLEEVVRNMGRIHERIEWLMLAFSEGDKEGIDRYIDQAHWWLKEAESDIQIVERYSYD